MTQATSKRTRNTTPPPNSAHASRRARSVHPAAALTAVPDDIAAQVERELAKQREELTAKLLAEKAERERIAAEKAAAAAKIAAEKAAAEKKAAAKKGVKIEAAITPDEMAVIRMLRAKAEQNPLEIEDDRAGVWDVPENDYGDTERVQVELSALLDLLGVVRVRDVQEHVKRDDGGVMSPSNVRYHMRKLSHRGIVKKVEERYYLKGLGYRTRDCWSKDPQKLLEVIEGKKTVRS